MTARRALAAALTVVVLATVLGACGRRNPPRPPEGRESEYTYPRFYPAPATVIPAAADEAGGEAEVESEPEPDEDIRRLSPIPPSESRTSTTTYGPPPR